MIYIDVHAHILPGIDDGARDLRETLEMLRIAESDGTTHIVATPHSNRVRCETISNAVAHVNDCAREAGLTITVLPGSEIRLAPSTPEDFRAKALVCINHTSYVLIELPFAGTWTADIYRVIHDLQLAGAWPILSHAERYQAVERNPRILLDLVAMNVLLQVNADSLIGEAGTGPRRIAESLARAGIIHILASDAHGSVSRAPRLAGAFARLAELAGVAHAAFVGNAARSVIAGVHISAPPPVQSKYLDRPWFSRKLWESLRDR